MKYLRRQLLFHDLVEPSKGRKIGLPEAHLHQLSGDLKHLHLEEIHPRAL